MNARKSVLKVAVTALTLLASQAGTLVSNANEPQSWFNTLQKAHEFADAEIGEGPKQSECYEAYKEALTKTALKQQEIDELLAKASPEGKLYAACLSYYSRLERKSNNPDEPFAKLANDKEPVYYRSGCRGTNSTVGEVATAFLKQKRFLNFDLPALAVIKNTEGVSAPIIHLAKARILECAVVGEGDKSILYAYFKEAHAHADKNQFEWLVHNGSPAGKLYGATLLYAVDAIRGKEELQKLQSMPEKVSYQWGCIMSEQPVAQIASALLKDGHFQKWTLTIK